MNCIIIIKRIASLTQIKISCRMKILIKENKILIQVLKILIKVLNK